MADMSGEKATSSGKCSSSTLFERAIHYKEDDDEETTIQRELHELRYLKMPMLPDF